MTYWPSLDAGLCSHTSYALVKLPVILFGLFDPECLEITIVFVTFDNLTGEENWAALPSSILIFQILSIRQRRLSIGRLENHAGPNSIAEFAPQRRLVLLD